MQTASTVLEVIGERGERGLSLEPYLLEHTPLLKLRGLRHIIDRLAIAKQGQTGSAIDVYIILRWKSSGFKESSTREMRVQKYGPEDRYFCLKVMRWHACLQGFDRPRSRCA